MGLGCPSKVLGDYMARLIAYLGVASLGFVIGVLIYVVGVLVLPWLIQSFPSIANLIASNRQIIEALLSGFIGSLLSVVIAYYWASKASEF